MELQQRFDNAKKITLLGAFKNALLAIIKLIGGYLGNSHALLADGVHSLADLLTDGLVLIASKLANQRPDADHQYGHQRIETAATVALAALLIFAGIGILFDAGLHLFQLDKTIPKWYVLVIAVIAILANELLYQLTKRIAEKINSSLLKANAWHHRSDAVSSLIVLIGVVLSILGFAYFDTIAAIIVAVMIIKMGWSLAWNCVLELVDTAASEEKLDKIRASALSISGVKMIHQLRTRLMGENIFVDMHVLVDPTISVSEGHYIATKVHHQLMQDVKEVVDVTVHIDPEDDDIHAPNLALPLRAQLIKALNERLSHLPFSQTIESFHLHYLMGKINLDVYLAKPVASSELIQIEKIIKAMPEISVVRFYFRR